MCERSADCTGDEHCQLVLRNLETGNKTVEYYCKGHLVLRIWEVEQDDRFAAVEATQLS
ncbi:hypothetical protein [Halosolutus gelatinilyticus]|uniref:hypothetical protein n=1 Tax=Halosolutus gelatinilyticus TaxID=2931975 RepID=UPI001FF50D7D|nr:hypothetical protein [Halosolutus gelatinilyticus]